MSVISFKCPNCDGELIFDPASGAYKCEYCGSKFTQEELDAMKPAEEQEKPAGSMDGSQASENTDGTQEEKKTEEEAVIYTCPSCGAELKGGGVEIQERQHQESSESDEEEDKTYKVDEL